MCIYVYIRMYTQTRDITRRSPSLSLDTFVFFANRRGIEGASANKHVATVGGGCITCACICAEGEERSRVCII